MQEKNITLTNNITPIKGNTNEQESPIGVGNSKPLLYTQVPLQNVSQTTVIPSNQNFYDETLELGDDGRSL